MENHGYEVMMFLLTKIKLTLSGFFAVGASIKMAAVMQSKDLVALTYILILVHILSGCAVIVQDWWTKDIRPSWSDQKYFKTGMKLLWFPVVIFCTQMTETVLNMEFPITKIAATVVVSHDLKGILENVFRLTGIDFWDAIGEYVKDKIKSRK